MKTPGKGIGGALLSLAFAFGIVAATISTTQAQYRNDRYYGRDRDDDRGDRDRNGRWCQDRDDDRRDRDRDWRWRQTRDDWRRDRNWNRNNRVYNNGPYGNYGRYDNNDRYGNGRNSGYGNYGYYNQGEVNRGFQQGLSTGSSDARRGQSYDPQRSRYFRNAPSLAFRQGFVQGYAQGYRQYSRYGYQRYGNNNGWGGILSGILGR